MTAAILNDLPVSTTIGVVIRSWSRSGVPSLLDRSTRSPCEAPRWFTEPTLKLTSGYRSDGDSGLCSAVNYIGGPSLMFPIQSNGVLSATLRSSLKNTVLLEETQARDDEEWVRVEGWSGRVRRRKEGLERAGHRPPWSPILAGLKVQIRSIERHSITMPSSQTVVATHPKITAAENSVLQLDHIGSSLTFPVHNSGILPATVAAMRRFNGGWIELESGKWCVELKMAKTRTKSEGWPYSS
ncbi:uncharacterized protein EI90DRAFT_3022384 [Cantharellus anzutake]|uniref:uncharacterized protein n=1 Tax=Cantharellus anzutake TaxID=1750568 RepID=UPI0019055E49|nr:uncharacterized protein EI90DRAFT_3022384 [Cantharellus anzutake]KAF8314326.1 hypothetical protein EI90DRAFT_3022384 [Cantharellus anzutake]